ncbi:MAG: flagellar hook-associated protein FlgK [Nitrospirae bacterium]|nr:flagellar hook-associated protein FlgK [Nitrospirota bacterium]
MAISGLLNIGLTALYATDQALNTTSNNVANANTPGYKRQEPIFQSVDSGIIKTTGTPGDGVQISDVSRMYNSFIDQQVNTESSNLAYWNNLQTGISQIENVFNEASTTGISPAISDFYNAWQDVSQTPEGAAQRATLLQKANYLSSRLSGAYTALNNERNQLLTDSQTLANTVNSTAAKIADLNTKIAGSSGSLDLLDQRDLLLQQLNSIAKVATFQDRSGMVTVMLGGEPIVQGAKTFALTANADTSNTMHFYVAVNPSAAQGTAGNPDVTTYLTGGQLKANLDLRDTSIPSYMNTLNAFAINLADTTNYYQRQGFGLDGQPGSSFFSSLSQLAKYASVPTVPTFTITSGNSIVIGGTTYNLTAGSYSSPAALVKQLNTDTNAAVTGISFSYDAANNKFIISNTSGAPVTVHWGSTTLQAEQTLGFTSTGDQTLNNNTNIESDTTVGKFTAGNNIFSTNGGTLNIKLGDNDTAPVTVTMGAGKGSGIGGAWTINDVVNAINNQAGTKVSATAVNTGTTTTPDYRIKIISNPDGRLADVRIGVTTTDSAGNGLNLLATSTNITSVSVADPTTMVSNAQYKIDYINAASYGNLSSADAAGYQVENADSLSYTIKSGVTIKAGVGGNSDINFTVVGGAHAGTYTASIAAATYNSTSSLQTAVIAALNAQSGAGTWTAGPAVAGQINITNSTGGVVTFNWGNAATTATPQELGYTSSDFQNLANGASDYSVNAPSFNSQIQVNGAPLTIPGGTYTGPQLAAALQTQLDTISATATVTYNTSGSNIDRFTISNPAGAGAAALTFDWTNANSTAASMLGFSKSDAPITVPVGGTLTSDFSTGIYWRVQESTDGSTWTTVNPNTSYDPSNTSSLNQSDVNMISDSSGSFWRTFEFQGIKVRIDGNDISSATNPNGETFDVQLDQHAAQDITTNFTNSKQVAAASAMFTIDGTNNSIVFNVNGGPSVTATIPPGSYSNDPGQPDDLAAAFTSAINSAYQNSTGNALQDNLNVAYNANTKQFKLMMANGSDTINLLWSNSSSTAKNVFGFSGSNNSVVALGSSTVSDSVASVLLSASKGVPGDNRNATAIANLASENVFGGATPGDFYNSLVSNVGVQAASASNSQQFQSKLVDQLTQKQQEVSGVSMDQEASNLIMFQKAYEAAAKMITVANDLIATLIGMVK